MTTTTQTSAPVRHDDERTDRLAALRADLRAADWSARSADAGTMLTAEEHAELVSDLGVEG